jgi:dTDP-4-dehydrorhamnose reductase
LYPHQKGTPMRLLLTGASGQLGGYLLRVLREKGLPAVAWSGSRTGELFGFPLQPVNLAEPEAVSDAFHAARPTLIVHTAALASVAECFRDPPRAHRINAEGTAVLARLADQTGTRLLHVSTDLVFDGERGAYREQDIPRPLSVYGRSKAAAERAVLAFPRTVVVRVSLLFGPSIVGRPSFFDQQVSALREGKPCTLFADEWRTPLGLMTAAQALLAVARSDFTGVLHLGGPERMSRLEMGQRLAGYVGCDPSVIVPCSRDQAAGTEPRPRDTGLDSSCWRRLFPEQPWPLWDEALSELIQR